MSNLLHGGKSSNHTFTCILIAEFKINARDVQLTLLVCTLEQGRCEGVEGREGKEEGRFEWKREESGEEEGRWGTEFGTGEGKRDCEMWEGVSNWEIWEGNDEKGGGGREICGRAEPNDKIRKM